MKKTFCLIFLVYALVPKLSFFAQDCSHGATTSPKDNTLFLYFPTASDATFPEYDPVITTSPLAAFDVADLDNTIGTTAQLRDRIFEIVTEDYCEFNVRVVQTTTFPVVAGITNWQILGAGTDSYTYGTGHLFGVAQDVDLGDNDNQDYARVFAGSFGDAYGGAGGALNGTNSTLERWARAIGHTCSHEAGHNYGLGHCDAGSQATEDGPRNHIMNTSQPANSGCTFTGVTSEDRAGRRRHFSDQSYELLAHNVGLNIMTAYNWDMVNPNADDAHSLEITILSTATNLTINWWYNGSTSPWSNPTIVNTGSTITFKGTVYNKFTLTYSTDKAWTGGANGVVPGGIEFHVGANFHEADPIIVYDALLKNSTGGVLALHPRMAGFDNGSFDLLTGDFIMAVYNPLPDLGELIIKDLKIQMLPRLVTIDAMISGVDKLTDYRGMEVVPHNNDCGSGRQFGVKDKRGFRLAALSDDRYVDFTYDSNDCKKLPYDMDGEGVDVNYCSHGTAVSLFPSTSVYVTATIIQPNVRHYDPKLKDYITGPLESKVFYQFAGRVPDLNNNGIDDLIDIREGKAIDKNGNGVIDNVEPGNNIQEPNGKLAWWQYLIWIILVIIIMLLYYYRRKSLVKR